MDNHENVSICNDGLIDKILAGPLMSILNNETVLTNAYVCQDPANTKFKEKKSFVD